MRYTRWYWKKKRIKTICFKWWLWTKEAKYIERNKKLSPLWKKEYIFLKLLYMYMTKQILKNEDKKQLYQSYIELVDLCYFPNRPDFQKNFARVIYLSCQFLLKREVKTEYTFIILNDYKHLQKMFKVLDLLYTWALNEYKGNFLSENEFWKNMEFIRKEFNKEKIDFNYHIGKWPKKLRKRFWREK